MDSNAKIDWVKQNYSGNCELFVDAIGIYDAFLITPEMLEKAAEALYYSKPMAGPDKDAFSGLREDLKDDWQDCAKAVLIAAGWKEGV